MLSCMTLDEQPIYPPPMLTPCKHSKSSPVPKASCPPSNQPTHLPEQSRSQRHASLKVVSDQTPHDPTSALFSSRSQDEPIETSALPPPGSVWCQQISLGSETNVMTQRIHTSTAENTEEARADGRTALIG